MLTMTREKSLCPSLNRQRNSSTHCAENFGVWKDGEYIAIHTYKLKEILTKMGFNYTSIISSWGDREWTKKDYNRNTFQISFTGQRFRTIAIKWQTINSLE